MGLVTYHGAMLGTAQERQNVKKARENVVRVLARYGVTLPEIIGVTRATRDPDTATWRSVRSAYERVQKRVFAQTYPSLWRKIKNR